MKATRHYVSILGGYDVPDEALKAAEQTGKLLAEAGIVVVTGGRWGVSEAAARGVTEAGGVAIGILPGSDRSEANAFLSYSIATGIGLTRNALVAMNGEVVIAFDGAFGTLSEIAHAALDGKPLILVGDWQIAGAGIDQSAFTRASTPEEAATKTAEFLKD